MSFTLQHRDHLDKARERKRSAQDKLAAARKATAMAHDAGDPQMIAASQAATELAHGELELAQQLESTLLGQLAGVSAGIGVESFLSDPGMLRDLETLAHSTHPIGGMNLGLAMSRGEVLADLKSGRTLASTGSPGAGFDYSGEAARRAPYFGVIPQLRRQLRLLDLIPSAGLDAKVLPYVQETGSFDTAAETAETSVKPTGEMTLTDAEAVARTIAHWMKLNRQTLADVAGLASAVQNRLIYGVKRRLEAQILAGDGQGENILGILNTTGVGTVAYSSTELAADLALDGVTDVLLSNAIPTGVILNPRDWAAMLRQKSSGSGEYMSMGPFVATAQTLWGVDAIPSPVIPQGTALVADFEIGATVFVREGVNLRISDAADDDFTRNRVTALAEGRFALAIWQPGAFAIVQLSA